jgi:hypothetical protein
MAITISPQYALALGVTRNLAETGNLSQAETHLAENMACKCLDHDSFDVHLLNAFVMKHMILPGRHHHLHVMWATLQE